MNWSPHLQIAWWEPHLIHSTFWHRLTFAPHHDLYAHHGLYAMHSFAYSHKYQRNRVLSAQKKFDRDPAYKNFDIHILVDVTVYFVLWLSLVYFIVFIPLESSHYLCMIAFHSISTSFPLFLVVGCVWVVLELSNEKRLPKCFACAPR